MKMQKGVHKIGWGVVKFFFLARAEDIKSDSDWIKAKMQTYFFTLQSVYN